MWHHRLLLAPRRSESPLHEANHGPLGLGKSSYQASCPLHMDPEKWVQPGLTSPLSLPSSLRLSVLGWQEALQPRSLGRLWASLLQTCLMSTGPPLTAGGHWPIALCHHCWEEGRKRMHTLPLRQRESTAPPSRQLCLFAERGVFVGDHKILWSHMSKLITTVEMFIFRLIRDANDSHVISELFSLRQWERIRVGLVSWKKKHSRVAPGKFRLSCQFCAFHSWVNSSKSPSS